MQNTGLNLAIYNVYGCGRSQRINLNGVAMYFQTDYVDWHIPQNKYSWLMFCCDAHDGFDSHIDTLRYWDGVRLFLHYGDLTDSGASAGLGTADYPE